MVLSRDCFASELSNNDIWSHGPVCLKEDSLPFFSPETQTNIANKEILQEQRKTLVHSVSHDNSEFELLFKFSS